MEKLSRVKKYEELRKSIEVDNSIDNSLHAHTSVEQEEALKKFDSSIFKKVEIQEDTSYTPEREKEIVKSEDHKSLTDDTFTNEYLDDFIKEVRDYNIKKGNRESENTQADILYQLNASNRAKRSQYIQEIKDDIVEEPKKTVLSKDDIALEVANLLREDIDEESHDLKAIDEYPSAGTLNSKAESDDMMQYTKELNIAHMNTYDDISDEQREEIPEKQKEEDVKKQHIEEESMESPILHAIPPKTSKKVIQPIIQEEIETEDDDEIIVHKNPKDTVLHKKLLEETQQLRVQMDEYEDELTDLSDGVEKTNKLLNFVLCFLILVLLVIIGFIVYSLWKAGGI